MEKTLEEDLTLSPSDLALILAIFQQLVIIVMAVLEVLWEIMPMLIILVLPLEIMLMVLILVSQLAFIVKVLMKE